MVRALPADVAPMTFTPQSRSSDAPAAASRHPRALILIALFKLFKCIACLTLAATAFHLLRPDADAGFSHWLESLTWATRHGFLAHAVDWLLGLGPHQFRVFGSMALVYALLYAVQGVGLWMAQRWAEYLVVLETCLLLPFELWELAQRFSAFKLAVLAINVAVVVYLVRLLRVEVH
jgi:uncharacterized membrane protein (DUF2068 family)